MIKNKTQKLALTGLMASLVMISTFIKVPIPIGAMNTMVHLGNVFCIFSAFLLGPVFGGLAAGLGSLLFDLLNPNYVASAPLTFIFKFLMAFICGAIAKKMSKDFVSRIFAASCAVLVYMLLYLTKGFIYNFYLLDLSLEVTFFLILKAALIVLINGILAVFVSVGLWQILEKQLNNFSS